jgi:hypothetical protein
MDSQHRVAADLGRRPMGAAESFLAKMKQLFYFLSRTEFAI